jgi:4a-hydroxytetrahydrobiopterin dehydratase
LTRLVRTGSVMAMTLLALTEITDAVADLPGWGGDSEALRCRYTAPDFPSGIALVDAVAVAAEAAGHHPDIDIRWRDVLFVLSTHSEGGVTDKDVALATQIDRLARDAGVPPAGTG